MSRLTLRWRLTLLHTAIFMTVGAAVVVMVYLHNRTIISRMIISEVDVMSLSGPEPTAYERTEPSASRAMLSAIEVQRNEAIGTILVQWIAAMLIMTVLVGLLAWWATGRVLNRVHVITSQARRISKDNLHERIAMRGPADELKELSDTLDDLLARLDGAFSAQARFIANASHELRTPLAVARTTLQVGLSTNDPERIRTARDELLRNNDRSIALINGLLTLARGEQQARRHESLRLDNLIRDAVQESAQSSTATGPRLLIDDLQACTVTGDPTLLAQLVRNLIDNAMRYNTPGGKVLLRLRADGHLTISNTGPLIDPGDIERLFEPFWRGAGRAGRTDGAGLGLSIVRAIASSHGGRVTACPLTGGGLEVEVHLPTSSHTLVAAA